MTTAAPAVERTLVTVDVGNRKRKFRRHAESWVAEDSLVRRPAAVTGLLGASVRFITLRKSVTKIHR
ncbi:MAG: hypothetical protein WCJ55_14780 [Chloroflexales bacterium]